MLFNVGFTAFIRRSVWLAVLLSLLETRSLFADDFLDLPIHEPTNNLTVAKLVNAAPLPAPGTNAMATNGMAALDSQYQLAIGDRVSFEIKEDEGDPQFLTVMDSGDLQIPYIGLYPAAEKTCKQLASQLKAALEKEYYYTATVIISVDLKAKTRGKVYLVGAVRDPGPEEIPNDEPFSLSKAIMRAGGFTDYADGRRVQVTRAISGGGQKTYITNVEKILAHGKIDSDMTLEPGDLIYVKEKTVNF